MTSGWKIRKCVSKVLIDFGKLLQRIGANWLNERFNVLRDDVEGQSRIRWSEYRVEPIDFILQVSKILGLRSMMKVLSVRDDFVVYVLFYFEPVHIFQYRGDVFSFGGCSYCTSEGVGSNWRREIYCSWEHLANLT